MVFVSNRSGKSINGFNDNLKKAGFSLNTDFFNSPGAYASATAQVNGPDGSNGTKGNQTSPTQDVDGNTAGAAGTSAKANTGNANTNGRGVAKQYEYVNDTNF